MSDATFSADERAAMRDAGITVFENRIILAAQPPVSTEALREVAAHCSGPLPDELVALWQVAFGGELDYALTGTFGGRHAALSFTELFYPDSDGYHDLWGWIDHELELAEEAAAARGGPPPTTLDALPFGGFEYLERLYVRVAPGVEHGAVLAWQKGLPPAWTLHRTTDSVARLATDVRALFRQLHLAQDPEDAPEHGTGVGMLEAIDSLEARGAAGHTASDKLRALVRSAVLDWRAAVEDRSVSARPHLRRLALEHAAASDDLMLLERLVGLGCDPDELLRAGGSALDHALAARAMRVARWLLDRGSDASRSLQYASRSVDAALGRELLARGARPDVTAALDAAHAMQIETALVIGLALSADDARALAHRAREAANRLERSASRIAAGELVSNESADQHRARAAGLRRLADELGRSE